MSAKGQHIPPFNSTLYDAAYPTPEECRQILADKPEILMVTKAFFKMPKASRKKPVKLSNSSKFPALPKFTIRKTRNERVPVPRVPFSSSFRPTKEPGAQYGMPLLSRYNRPATFDEDFEVQKEREKVCYGVQDLSDNAYYLGWAPMYCDMIERKRVPPPPIKVESFMRAYSIPSFESEYAEPPVFTSTKRRREKKKKLDDEKNELILKELYEAVFDDELESVPDCDINVET